MVQTERSVEERRVLEALARLEESDRVATLHAIAIESGVDMAVVHALVNALFANGDVTPQLTLTEKGRKALGR
ncbi:MAG TPA: hypothetical protein VIK95_04460 [Egibacteraceae bacterium]